MKHYKLFTFAALALLAAFALGGCAASAPQPVPGPDSSASSTSPESIVLPVPESSEEEPSEGVAGEPQRLVVADAAMYRGTVTAVEEVEEAGSNLLLVTLKSETGTGYTPAVFSVYITADTRLSFEKEKLEPGAYLEAYYGAPPAGEQKIANAIAVNLLTPAELSVYNGELVDMQKRDDGGVSLLLKPLLGEGMEALFHISEDTSVFLNLDELKKGDKLNIYFSGAATFSIPPQSTALELRRYAAPEE